jgi:putative CocE/NonD family hydrolase
MKKRGFFFCVSLIFIFCSLVPALFNLCLAQEEKVSRPGLYKGYSEEKYGCCSRESTYVPMPTDGTRLAIDIYHPIERGTQKKVAGKFPVLLTTTRYHRTNEVDGKPVPLPQNHLAPYASQFVKHGYIVAIADVRGTGASFGIDHGPFSPLETEDSYYLIEWLAKQQWSEGKVGMFGLSYLGITQHKAASKKPPALKALFPQVAFWDMYAFVYNNGIFIDDFIKVWGDANVLLDANITIEDQIYPAARVDKDKDGTLRAEASFGHGANFQVFEESNHHPYRDSRLRQGVKWYLQNSPFTYANEIQDSKVAIYTLGGWFDGFTRDIFIPYNTIANPQKVIVGPWNHGSRDGFDMAAEHLRWFDYHLKGIQNGIMVEDPITYYTINADPGTEWKTSKVWPLENQNPSVFYFRAGKSGSVASINDGLLSGEKSETLDAADNYTIDYSTTTGKKTCWYATAGLPFELPDRKPQDEKGLTYTSAALSSKLEVTGHPVVQLWVSCNTSDVDVFAYLEDVDANGFSHYVTEGRLRALHRAQSHPPYAFAGLPYHSGNVGDVKVLKPGVTAKLAFDLLATSYVFKAGHRIRIAIMGADMDNFHTPERVIPPVLSVYRNKSLASNVVLPVIPQKM